MDPKILHLGEKSCGVRSTLLKYIGNPNVSLVEIFDLQHRTVKVGSGWILA